MRKLDVSLEVRHFKKSRTS